MRDHDNGAAFIVEPFEQRQDLLRRHAVQVAGRFVGQDEVGVIHQAAGDGHPLLLTAGELGGAVPQPIFQPDQRGQLVAALAGGRAGATLVVQRNLDVFHDRQLLDQVIRLKDEADAGSADHGKLVVAHLGDIVVAEKELAAGRLVQATEQVEQRALAGTGRAHDGHIVPFGNGEAHAAQSPHRFRFEDVVLRDINQPNRNAHCPAPGPPPDGPPPGGPPPPKPPRS